MTRNFGLTRLPLRPARGLWDIDHLFGQLLGERDSTWPGPRAGRDWAPAVDLEEKDDELVVRADLPGVEANDIKVTLDDGHLTIEGEREEKTERTEGRAHHIERFTGAFSRTIHLPERTDPEAIAAKYTNGVLEVTVPYTEEAKPREVKVAAK